MSFLSKREKKIIDLYFYFVILLSGLIFAGFLLFIDLVSKNTDHWTVLGIMLFIIVCSYYKKVALKHYTPELEKFANRLFNIRIQTVWIIIHLTFVCFVFWLPVELLTLVMFCSCIFGCWICR